ncbi:MAG: DNA internalization-related competence protein ComEC/Rec2 [Clostridiales Family XIII bacterium]|jgi:competence protein ComEC|nr:DNA internalization-related competence protein ComEC/Rec2 [Clostridiales Family XIII bacterium]
MFTRRPLFIITVFYITGIAFGYIFLPGVWVLSALVPGIFAIFAAKGKNRIIIAVATVAFISGSLYCQSEFSRQDPLAKYAVSPYQNVRQESVGQEGAGQGNAVQGDVRQTGRVLKIARSDSGIYRLTVKVPGGRNVLLRVKPDGVKYGEALPEDYEFEKSVLGRKITFSGGVEMPTERRNPGCFDYSLYLKTQNVRVIVKCADSDITASKEGDIFGDLYNSLGQLKYNFFARSKACMSKSSFALMSGILFGDTSEIEDDVYERFQHHGISHILSVSGIHVMIVYGFVTMLLGRRKTTPVYLVIAAALVYYAVLSEFSPTVVRAVVMIGVHIFSKVARRRYDLLNGTALAALLMLAVNPLSLFQAGFQLSFLAVFLLAFYLPLTARFTGRRDTASGTKLSSSDLEVRGYNGTKETLLKKAVNTLIPLFIIQTGMAPLVAYNFNFVSWSALLLNIPVVFLSELVIPIGLLMFIMSAAGVPAAVFDLAADGESIIIECIDRIVLVADNTLNGSVSVVSPPAPLLLLFYAMIFLLSSEGFRLAVSRRRVKTIIIMIAAVTLASLITGASNVCQINKAALTFVDVGQGDCLHIRTPDGHNYLIDGGGRIDYDVGKNVLLPYLLKNGVSHIDGVFASHLHTDHWQGLKQLAEYMDIKTAYLYEANAYSSSVPKTMPLTFIAQGDRVMLGGGIFLDVLYPSRKTPDEYKELVSDGADENKSSLLMQLNYNGVRTLMTGDLGEEGERSILSELTDAGKTEALCSRVLKVGHHGSRTSTSDEFLTAVAPDIAVIQVGRNTFGHPTQAVLEKLAADDIMTYRNDTDGAVMFEIESGRIIYGGTQLQKNRTRLKK